MLKDRLETFKSVVKLLEHFYGMIFEIEQNSTGQKNDSQLEKPQKCEMTSEIEKCDQSQQTLEI